MNSRHQSWRGRHHCKIRCRVDWDRPPWNRWSFKGSQSSFNCPDTKGNVTTPLEYAPKGIGEINFRDSKEKRTITEFLDDTYTDGFLIFKDGKIVHESYYNGMDVRTLHLCQSVSKSICATSGAILIDKGILDPNELVASIYLSSLKQLGRVLKFNMSWI